MQKPSAASTKSPAKSSARIKWAPRPTESEVSQAIAVIAHETFMKIVSAEDDLEHYLAFLDTLSVKNSTLEIAVTKACGGLEKFSDSLNPLRTLVLTTGSAAEVKRGSRKSIKKELAALKP